MSENLQERIMSEIERIAFSGGEDVTVSQKLTALRLLAHFTGIDKGVKPEEPETPIFIDNIADPRLDALLPAIPKTEVGDVQLTFDV